MRTIRTKVYSFNELNENAKEVAVNEVRNRGIDTDFIYDDAHETVNRFHEVFGTKENSRSWLDVNFDNIEDNVLKLEGLRLRTYLINNFGNQLYKRKYLGNIGQNRIITHPCIKTNFYNMAKGAISNSSNFYYSRILKDNSCVLTGVCYDNDLLQPIYDFIDNYKNPILYNSCLTFEELITDCFKSLEKSIDSEVEYRNSSEAISEDIEANDYEFTIEGKLFNS